MKVDDKVPGPTSSLGPNLKNSGPNLASPTSNSGPNPTSESGAKVERYTEEEVTQHSSAEDLWLVINGKVYNMTKYLKYHPGKGILNEKEREKGEGREGGERGERGEREVREGEERGDKGERGEGEGRERRDGREQGWRGERGRREERGVSMSSNKKI